VSICSSVFTFEHLWPFEPFSKFWWGCLLLVDACQVLTKLAPIKGSRCFLERETLASLLSNGWLQEQILA